jgi:hypothetical protein
MSSAFAWRSAQKPWDVVGLVLRRGLALTAAGIALGIFISAFATQATADL